MRHAQANMVEIRFKKIRAKGSSWKKNYTVNRQKKIMRANNHPSPPPITFLIVNFLKDKKTIVFPRQ